MCEAVLVSVMHYYWPLLAALFGIVHVFHFSFISVGLSSFVSIYYIICHGYLIFGHETQPYSDSSIDE
jgi:hypothetical protein